MQLQSIDWLIVAVYGVASLIIGLLFTKRAGRSLEQYFLSGRKLPWWLLGTSMVATTFSTDTPNLVTDLVRTGGVSMNWLWWAFLITGMLTVFFYAKLWRRSGALTDINFYELRYSGAPAAFLRGFRAIYLGVFFNVMIMATVTLAAIKIAGVLLGLDAHVTVVLAALITMVYSSTAGLWGVVVTDFFQFALAMIGSIAAAYYAVTHPSVGGLAGLFSNPQVKDKLSLLPDFSDRAAVIAVLIVPLAVQWWSTWYPGSEPGGGGYMAQRMLAARNEKQAMAATLWFNIAHYAVRPWPWILVALASLIVYPQLVRHPGAPSLCRSVDHRPRPRLSGHARVRAARAARAGRGVAGGGLYVDDQHPPQLGRLLHRRRRLSPLHPARCLASALCERRQGRDVRPDDPRRARRALARPCHAGVSDPAANRRRHRSHFPVAVVLVAHQRVGRNRRHGDLIPARGVFAFRSCAAWLCAARAGCRAGARRPRDDRRLVGGDAVDAANRSRRAAIFL